MWINISTNLQLELHPNPNPYRKCRIRLFFLVGADVRIHFWTNLVKLMTPNSKPARFGGPL